MRVTRFTCAALVLALLACSKAPETAAEPASAESPRAEPATPSPEPKNAPPPPEGTSGEPTAPPPTPAPPGTAPPTAPPSPASSSAEEAALETAFRARACILRRQDRDGVAALDVQHGFKDSADFSARFAKAAAANAPWAERVMADALTATCPVPGGP